MHAPLLSEKLKERNKWWQIKLIEKNGSVKSDKYPYEEISVIGKGLWLARGKEGLVVAKHVKCP